MRPNAAPYGHGMAEIEKMCFCKAKAVLPVSTPDGPPTWPTSVSMRFDGSCRGSKLVYESANMRRGLEEELQQLEARNIARGLDGGVRAVHFTDFM